MGVGAGREGGGDGRERGHRPNVLTWFGNIVFLSDSNQSIFHS